PARAEDLALGEQDEAEGRDGRAARAFTGDDGQRLGPVEAVRRRRLHSVLTQDLAEVLGLALVGGDQADAKALAAPLDQGLGQPGEAPGELLGRTGIEHELTRV